MNIPPSSSNTVSPSAAFFVKINSEGKPLFVNEALQTFLTKNSISFSNIITTNESTFRYVIDSCLNIPGQTLSVRLDSKPPGIPVTITSWSFTSLLEHDTTYIYGFGSIETEIVGEKHGSENDVDKNASDRLNQVLESISDGFFTVDKNFTILYWNHRAEEIFRIHREKILGKNLWQVYEGSIPQNFQTAFQNAFQLNSPVQFQEFFPLLNTWFEVSAYPYDNLLSVFFKDISRKKKNDDEVANFNERLKLVAKATKDVIWDWDLVTDEVVWNENVVTMFGYTSQEVNSNDDWWYINLHDEDRNAVKNSIETHVARKEVNWQIDYRFRCADGGFKYIHDRGFAVYDQNKRPIRMIGAMQDHTETKANEFILKELNNSLEKRAKELADSNDELERFAYVTSHDLQEPLRMVSSFLQLLKKRYSDKLDGKAHEYIGFAVDGAERMKTLILDLLEYSRVNTNKSASEEVDLNSLMSPLVLTYKQLLEEKGGKILCDNLPVIRGNKTQLFQLFQNLVGNGLKYNTSSAPKIKITVTELEHDYRFVFEDNGIGIDPKYFKKIFVIFQRLHHKNEFSGTGIGLAICKKIVDKHGGKIWVESEPEKGSSFYFLLPK